MINPQIKQQLSEYKSLYEDGLISQQEYDQEKQALLAQLRATAAPEVAPTPAPAQSVTLGREVLYDGYETGSAEQRFVLEKRLGNGTYGQVWKALDLHEQALLGGTPYKALKFLHPNFKEDHEHLDALKKEALQSSQLNHPHIVNITQFVQGADGWAFIVMEYLQGKPLDVHLRQHQALSIEQVLTLFKPLCEALDFAHQKQLCHRDLKPANLHLGDDGRLRLLDFGLAYRLRRTASQCGIDTRQLKPSGTVEYMAPETFYQHEPKASQDIHALACVLYECLTGEPPYNEYKAPCRRDDDPRPPKPECLSLPAWQALQQGFAMQAEQRQTSATALWQAVYEGQYGVFNRYPDIDGWPSKQVKDWQSETAKAFGYQNTSYQDRLADGSLGPRMVILPNGIYQMGSPEDEPEREPWDQNSEKPHKVQIAAFAIGQTAVTFADYQLYCQATGIDLPGDVGWGKGRRPVIRISWYEAYYYAQWLSSQTGKPYRLLSEAEWEYACRAGTTTPFYTGQTIQTSQANFHGNYTYNGSEEGDYLGQTVEVGRYAPNAFGLYDMHGNVLEWVSSAYERNYLGQEQQLTDKGSSALRVVRGGSWGCEPRWLRSANRDRDAPGFRVNDVGFRLAQDLTL